MARTDRGQMISASTATISVSSERGSSGYGQVRGDPKRKA